LQEATGDADHTNDAGVDTAIRECRPVHQAQGRAQAERAEFYFDPFCLTCPGREWLGPFSVCGIEEQMFGAK
jgi:hypothetical protein